MPNRSFRLNGTKISVDAADEAQLLYVLREQLGQLGPRFGCGVSQCGACTVLVDGEIVRSCTRLTGTVPDGSEIRTLDGLANGRPHPLQQAFIEEQAAQCAFCVNGMIMGALGWLEQRKAAGNVEVPTDGEIRDFLSGASPDSTFNYICRCGAHNRIVAAIESAAKEVLR
jgi:aerobic-type carbon monoxide dehydrogenase small subunit (CoxS/CutS family)